MDNVPPSENQKTMSFDVVVTGATPAGIMAAIRASREGYHVLLTQHNRHIGGMCSNGLGQWDAHSNHRRCALFTELLQRIETHYRETYGNDSAAHIASQYLSARYPVGSYEPSVIENIFNQMVAEEKRITLLLDTYPQSVQKAHGKIQSVTLTHRTKKSPFIAVASIFIDATYEGDLLALSGVHYRVGRESRDEFNEPHAGQLLTKIQGNDSLQKELYELAGIWLMNQATQGEISAESSYAADTAIQAYNTRPCVTQSDDLRILPESPPDNYDPTIYREYKRKSLTIKCHINGKNSFNSAILPGRNWLYPEADWETRHQITQEHHDFALGLMYFLQNDSFISREQRQAFRRWGLSADEFTDNNHMPYEMYVREARRMCGQHILSEGDLSPRPGFLRPLPFHDSIAFTDWYMDSHSCHRDYGTYGEVEGVVGNKTFPYEGKLILTEQLRPGMIPYRCLLAKEVSNLITPVCVSATHVAWGAIRLEPVWIHLGEVAGLAASLALQTDRAPANLDVALLQHCFIESGGSIAYFKHHESLWDSKERMNLELSACHGEHDHYGPHPEHAI